MATVASTMSQGGRKLAKGKKPAATKGRKKKQSVESDDSIIEVVIELPKEEPKSRRGRTRKSDEMEDDEAIAAPPPKRRTRNSVAQESVLPLPQQTESEDEVVQPKKKAAPMKKVGRASRSRKVSNASQAASVAGSIDERLDQELEDELDRQLESMDVDNEYDQSPPRAKPAPARRTRSSVLEIESRDVDMFGDIEVDEAALEAELDAMEVEEVYKTLPKGKKAAGTRKVSAKQTAAEKKKAAADAENERLRLEEEEREQAEFEAARRAEQEAAEAELRQAEREAEERRLQDEADALARQRQIEAEEEEERLQIEAEKEEKRRQLAERAEKKRLAAEAKAEEKRQRDARVAAAAEAKRKAEEQRIKAEALARQKEAKLKKLSNPPPQTTRTTRSSRGSRNMADESMITNSVLEDEPSPSPEPAPKPKRISKGKGKALTPPPKSPTPERESTSSPDQEQESVFEMDRTMDRSPELGNDSVISNKVRSSGGGPPRASRSTRGQRSSQRGQKERSVTPEPVAVASDQSSDAENRPPSSRPASREERSVLEVVEVLNSSIRSNKSRNPLERSIQGQTPTAHAVHTPSRATMRAAAARNGLKSDTAWEAVELDTVFTHLASPEKENPGETSFVDRLRQSVSGGLSEKELDMSVEEWVRWNAKQAEEGLRARCEGMVGVFEREGARALGVLEGLRVAEDEEMEM